MNSIDIDGQQFQVETLKIDHSDEDWNITIIGDERRVERLGDELCQPRIILYGISTKGSCLIDSREISVDIGWDTPDEFADDSYFTLMGEGFWILSCRLRIFRVSATHHRLEFHGLTDYPFGIPEKDENPFTVTYDFIWDGNV